MDCTNLEESFDLGWAFGVWTVMQGGCFGMWTGHKPTGLDQCLVDTSSELCASMAPTGAKVKAEHSRSSGPKVMLVAQVGLYSHTDRSWHTSSRRDHRAAGNEQHRLMQQKCLQQQTYGRPDKPV